MTPASGVRARSGAPQEPPAWQLESDIYVRRAGFAYQLLAELQAPDLVAALDAVLAADRECRAASRTLRSTPAPTPRGTLPRRVTRSINGRRPVSWPEGTDPGAVLRSAIDAWNEALGRRTAAVEAARAAFELVLPAVRERFACTVRDERFQEAVLLNSPDMLVNGLRPFVDGRGTPTAQRRRETTLLRYLQRCCARADTASFYGPIDFGRFDSSARSAMTYTWRQAAVAPRRRVLLSHWAAEALAAAMERDQRTTVDRRPVRSALVRIQDLAVVVPGTGARASLHPAELAVLERADGSASLRDIAAGAELPLDEVARLASRLSERRLLRTGFPVHAHEFDSFDQVEAIARSLADPAARDAWSRTCGRVRTLLGEFESAPAASRESLLAELERTFQEVTGCAPRRGQGQVYADRLVLYEECSGEVQELTIGGPLLAALQARLQTGLDLLASTAHRIWRDQADSAGEELREVVGRGGRMPFLQLLWECERRPRLGDGASTPFTRKMAQGLDWWNRVWERLVPASGDRCVALTRDELEHAFGRFEPTPGFVAAVDLMIAAESPEAIARGEYRIVLSEVHPVLLATHKAMTTLHPDLPGMLRRGEELLADLVAPEQQAILSSRRVSKIDSWLLGRPLIELEWMDTSLAGQHVAIADVDVCVPADDLPHLRADAVPQRMQLEMPLVTDESFPAAVWAFGRPTIWHRSVDRGRHTPRLEVDGVVFQRERWKLPGDELPPVRPPIDSFDNLLALWRWREAQGLPDAVYWVALSGDDGKPALLDFLSPLSCFNFIQRIAVDRPPLLISEMLPGQRELWLRADGTGHGYVCELRFNAWQPLPGGAGGAGAAGVPAAPAAAAVPEGPGMDLDELGDHLSRVQAVLERLVTED